MSPPRPASPRRDVAVDPAPRRGAGPAHRVPPAGGDPGDRAGQARGGSRRGRAGVPRRRGQRDRRAGRRRGRRRAGRAPGGPGRGRPSWTPTRRSSGCGASCAALCAGAARCWAIRPRPAVDLAPLPQGASGRCTTYRAASCSPTPPGWSPRCAGRHDRPGRPSGPHRSRPGTAAAPRPYCRCCRRSALPSPRWPRWSPAGWWRWARATGWPRRSYGRRLPGLPPRAVHRHPGRRRAGQAPARTTRHRRHRAGGARRHGRRLRGLRRAALRSPALRSPAPRGPALSASRERELSASWRLRRWVRRRPGTEKQDMRVPEWLTATVTVVLLLAVGAVGWQMNRSALRTAESVHRADLTAAGRQQHGAHRRVPGDVGPRTVRLRRRHTPKRCAPWTRQTATLLADFVQRSVFFRHGAALADRNGRIITSVSGPLGLPPRTTPATRRCAPRWTGARSSSPTC